MTRFFAFLAAVAIAAVGLSAIPTPPPASAAPPDTNKVLIVGDSVAFGIGCVLGDDDDYDNTAPAGCTPQPGFTARNEYNGACTIALGAVLGHNGNLYPSGCADWQARWKALIDNANVPFEMVVLNTGGWEVVDRWTKAFPAGSPGHWSPPPNYQWGSNSFEKAANRYAKKLRNAIQILSSRGAIVLVMNSLYVNPPAPDPGTSTYYEAYGPGQPANWASPSTGVLFRASETKIEQFNAILKLVVKEFPRSQARFFDFQKPFSLPSTGSDGDGLEYAANLSITGGATSPAHPCGFLDLGCISPRQGDGLHLSPAGHQQVLAPFLIPKVRSILKV